ncbi:MAG: hypothetical protein ACK5O2_00165 [Microthrixaceae bacterium]
MTDDDRSEVDDMIREELHTALQGTGRLTAPELADRLSSLRGTDGAHLESASRDPKQSRRGLLAVAAAVLVAIVAGAGVWLSTNSSDDADVDVVADEPDALDTSPFANYQPGWHTIDTSDLPVVGSASMALVGSQLAVSIVPPPDPGAPGSLFAYDLEERLWRELPAPPMLDPQIVGAGDRVVAVSASTLTDPVRAVDRWAVLDALDTEHPVWSEPASVPIAGGLAAANTLGPRNPREQLNLIWTGERVIDMTHGAVLDPVTVGSEDLEMPGDLSKYSHLLYSNAVWTGNEVVLAAISDGAALRWSSTGELLGLVEGLPTGPGASGDPAVSSFVIETTALGGNNVVMLFDQGSGDTLELDPSTGTWSEPADRPAVGCSPLTAWVGAPLVQACAQGPIQGAPLVLDGSKWTSAPAAPLSGLCCTWLGTDEALFWLADMSADNTSFLAFWIPDGSDTPYNTRPYAPDPQAVEALKPCTVDNLIDLGPMLPATVQAPDSPQRGMGGMGDIEAGGAGGPPEVCARHWGAGEGTGRHVTQRVGTLGYGLAEPSESGNFRWGLIEDGFGLEVTGDEPWSIYAYGITAEEFDELVRQLIAATP